MFSEIDIGGVLLAPIVVYALVAVLLMMILRPLLGRGGVTHAVWHPALFEAGLYFSLLCLLVLFA